MRLPFSTIPPNLTYPLPFSFDFCEPGETPDGTGKAHEGAKVSENLGQIILGERIRNAPYQVSNAILSRLFNPRVSSSKLVLSTAQDVGRTLLCRHVQTILQG
jgi:hypothetical protein